MTTTHHHPELDRIELGSRVTSYYIYNRYVFAWKLAAYRGEGK